MQPFGASSTIDNSSDLAAAVHSDAELNPSESSEESAAASRPRVERGEIWRKVLHMSPGLLPFALAALPHLDPLDPIALVVVTLIATLLTYIYIKSAHVVRRDNEHDFLLTAISYPALVVLSLILFPAHTEFACAVAVILAFGDGSAYLAGRLFGKRKLPWNPKKTWLGTCCFVLCSAPLAAVAYWFEARNPEVPFEFAALSATVAAVLAAIAESLPTRLSDNLRVGVASLVGLVATYYLAGEWFLSRT